MATDKVEVYHISEPDEINNKEENVILRALEGDPNRYKPLLQHPPPTSAEDQLTTPASMYTLETRYQPIPPKVLPKSKEPRVYYIEPKRDEQPLVHNGGMTTEEEPAQMIILEPKVISQPVLYSIVGAKSLPLEVANQTSRPANIIPPTVNVPPPVPEASPVLYSLVANPRLNVQIQEPAKETAAIPQQSSSTLYTVVGNPRMTAPIPTTHVPAAPVTVKQTSPILYSIVANPRLTSNLTYTNTPNAPPPAPPVKPSSVQPAPILYTLVGETQVPTETVKANRTPLAPIKRQTNGNATRAVVGDPTVPRKIQSIPPTKQSQPLPPISTPLLYSIVGQPNLSSERKPPVQKKTPPRFVVPNRRISRSLDRQTAPEPATERVTDIPPVKHKYQRRFQEPTIPKSETVFYPLSDHEGSPRSKKPRTTPWRTGAGQVNHRSFQIPNYDPMQLPDYISPYAYHPVKPYREQTVHPTSLPIIRSRYPYKPRIPVHESFRRDERKPPYDLWKPHSSERYPARSTGNPRLWDYEYEAQTDDDDDDDGNELGKQRHYRRRRPRTPWVPVW